MSDFPQQYGSAGVPQRSQESLTMAVLAGFGAMIVAALAWAAISYATGYQVGIIAIAVGFVVGFAVRFAGKGTTIEYGIIGGFLALLGCVLGNFLNIVAVVADLEGLGLMTTFWAFILSPNAIVEAFKETFSPMDLLFYGIAVYQGFRSAYGPSEEADEDWSNDSNDEDAASPLGL